MSNLRIPGTASIQSSTSTNAPLNGFILGWNPQLQADGVTVKTVFTFLAHDAQTAPAVASNQVLEGISASCITMDSSSSDNTINTTEEV